MDKKKILVVDDDDSIRDILTLMITRMGHEPETAEDGRIGLRMVKEFQPDLILLDLMMPNVNGFEVLQILQDAGNTTPVVIVTAFTEIAGLKDVKAWLQVTEVLKKPVKTDDLKGVLERTFAAASA